MEKCAFCSKILLGSKKEICLDVSEIDGVFCDEKCANGFIRQCVTELDTTKRHTIHKKEGT